MKDAEKKKEIEKAKKTREKAVKSQKLIKKGNGNTKF